MGKLKLDYGFKILLRGIRKALRRHFKHCGFGQGKYHWSEARWLIVVEDYLKQHVKIKKPSKRKVAATALLQFHSLGRKEKKSEKPKSDKSAKPKSVKSAKPKPVIVKLRLGIEGMELFKDFFENNNNELIEKFFTDSLIKQLWPTVLENLTYELCSKKKPNADLERTCRTITSMLPERFGLQLPQWWNDRFPKMG